MSEYPCQGIGAYELSTGAGVQFRSHLICHFCALKNGFTNRRMRAAQSFQWIALRRPANLQLRRLVQQHLHAS